jgi:hypothetical protein
MTHLQKYNGSNRTLGKKKKPKADKKQSGKKAEH